MMPSSVVTSSERTAPGVCASAEVESNATSRKTIIWVTWEKGP